MFVVLGHYHGGLLAAPLLSRYLVALAPVPRVLSPARSSLLLSWLRIAYVDDRRRYPPLLAPPPPPPSPPLCLALLPGSVPRAPLHVWKLYALPTPFIVLSP